MLGPNINPMMEPNEEPLALEIMQQARSLMGKASRGEQALIGALEKRYSGNTEDRTANNKAYAEAMREAHQRFPDDPDIAMLYVQSCYMLIRMDRSILIPAHESGNRYVRLRSVQMLEITFNQSS